MTSILPGTNRFFEKSQTKKKQRIRPKNAKIVQEAKISQTNGVGGENFFGHIAPQPKIYSINGAAGEKFFRKWRRRRKIFPQIAPQPKIFSINGSAGEKISINGAAGEKF